MKERPNGVTTGRLLSLVKGAKSFEQAMNYHAANSAPLFKEKLYEYMQLKSMTAKELITLSQIDRSYFYHILNGGKLPGRGMTLRLALCLGLNIEQTNSLLRLAEHSSLYPRVRRDALLIYGIEHGFTLREMNECLIREGEATLLK